MLGDTFNLANDARQLVPDRACGDCTACCVALRIAESCFQKRVNEPCAHLGAEGGCGIYATRPEICRVWHCGWRYLAPLGDEWRPDRARLIIMPRKGLATGFTLQPLENPREVLTADPVMELVAWCLDRSVPVAISVPTRAGHAAAALDLNDILTQTVRMGLFASPKAAMIHMIDYAVQLDVDPEPGASAEP